MAESAGPSFEQHSAIHRVSSVIDIKHTCGFLTLIKTGKKYASAPITHNDTTAHQRALQLDVTSPSTVKFCKDSANVAAAVSAGGSNSCSPQNGFKDSVSAEVLASELDSLDTSISSQFSTPKVPLKDCAGGVLSSPDRSRLALDIKESGMSKESGDHVAAGCDNNALEADWVLLDCCYGIPLFDSEVNGQVCERVASQGLCNKDR